MRAVTSASTSLSSFENALTEIKLRKLWSGFLLTRWHKRPREALKEQSSICPWEPECRRRSKVHKRFANPLVVEVETRFYVNVTSRVWKKILSRVSHRDEQRLKKARCKGGSIVFCFASRIWKMAVAQRIFNSTQPFYMSTNQPKLKVFSCLPSSPRLELPVASAKDDKPHNLMDYSNFLLKVISHGTAKHLGTGPLISEKHSIIAQAECKYFNLPKSLL